MSVSQDLPGWARGLAQRFRSLLDSLVGTMPLKAASLSVLPDGANALEVLATYDFPELPGGAAAPLRLGAAVLDWLKAHGRELVLAVPESASAEFYRVFIERGVRAALVVPIVRSGRLIGTVTAASEQVNAYASRHLQLLNMMGRELAAHFPEPVPALPKAVPPSPVRVEKPAAPVAPAPQPPREDAHIEADSLGRIAEWNEGAEGIFGWSRREVLGSFLTLFYRRKQRHLLDVTLLDELLRKGGGVYRGRAVCYDSAGLCVTCEMELSRLGASGAAAQGFRGRFRRVKPETLLPREEIQFGFARLFDFTNPVG